MKREEFVILIESIGIKNNYGGLYEYKVFIVSLWYVKYDFYNGSDWLYNISFDDLTPIKKYFEQELRSIKLKQLLK